MKLVLKQLDLSGEEGQSTLEYAIVFIGFLTIVGGLYTLFTFSSEGVLLDLIEQSTSHTIGGASLDGIKDLLLY